MSPCHSDNMSQGSQVSQSALGSFFQQCVVVSQIVTRSPIEQSLGQLKKTNIDKNAKWRSKAFFDDLKQTNADTLDERG